MDKEVDLATIRRVEATFREMSIFTGLKEDTIKDLLEKGWTYKRELEKSDVWIKLF